MAAITSAGSGNWSATGTWTGGAVPVEGDTVTIQSGHTVTVDQNITVGADSATAAISLTGTLNVPYDIASDYTLTCKGNLTVNSGGIFSIGTSSNRLNSARTFTVKLNYSASLSNGKYNMTVAAGGRCLWYGASKTANTTLASQANSGQNQIVVNNATGWRIGDIVSVVDETNRTKTEEFTISSLSGTTITLSGNLANTKASGGFVLNVSNNIIVTSYDTSFCARFFCSGHTTALNVFSNVMFRNIGYSGNTSPIFNQYTINNGNNDVNISCYSCFTTEINSGNHFNTFSSLADRQHGVVLMASSENIAFGTLNICKQTNYGLVSINKVHNIVATTFNLHSPATAQDAIFGDISLFVDTINISTANTAIANIGHASRISTANIKYCGIAILNFREIYIKTLNVGGNSTDFGSSGASGNIFIHTVSSTVNAANNLNGRVFINNYNNTVGLQRMYTNSNFLEADMTEYKTSPPAIKIFVNNTYNVQMPISGLMPTFYVNNNKVITLDIYTRTNSISTGVSAKLRIVQYSENCGLSTSEFDLMPASANTWTSKQVSLGTSTSAGFITLEVVVARGGASAFFFYIDDFTVTETNP